MSSPTNLILYAGWDNLTLAVECHPTYFQLAVYDMSGKKISVVTPEIEYSVEGFGWPAYLHIAFFRKAGVYYLSVKGQIVWSGNIPDLAGPSQYNFAIFNENLDSSTRIVATIYELRVNLNTSVYDGQNFQPPTSAFISTVASKNKEVLFNVVSGSLQLSTNTNGKLVFDDYVNYISPELKAVMPYLHTFDPAIPPSSAQVVDGYVVMQPNSIFGSTGNAFIGAANGESEDFCIEAICSRHAIPTDPVYNLSDNIYIGMGSGAYLCLRNGYNEGSIWIENNDPYYGYGILYSWESSAPAFPEDTEFHVAIYRKGNTTYIAVDGNIIATTPYGYGPPSSRGFYIITGPDSKFIWKISSIRGVSGMSPYSGTNFTPPSAPLPRLIPDVPNNSFSGKFEVQSGPDVGEYLPLDPAFVVKREVVGVKEGTSTFSIELYEGQFDKINLYVEGYYWPEESWSISGNQITLSHPLSVKQGSSAYARTEGYIVVEYVVHTRTPFYYWLTNTYSGSLIGTSGLPVKHLTLRKELHRQLLPTGVVDELTDIVVNSETTPPPIARYLKTVRDPLEKAVLATTVASIYLNS